MNFNLPYCNLENFSVGGQFEIFRTQMAPRNTGRPGSRCGELLFLQKKKPLCKSSACETRHYDTVTAIIYCYITTEFTRNLTLAFQHVEVLCYNSLNLQRFVWGKMKVFAHKIRHHDLFMMKYMSQHHIC